MRSIKRFALSAAAMAVCMGIGTSAMAFSDMPEGEMGAALQAAVEAKLMDGVDDEHIAPNDNITRAQMATIIARAFGASKLSSTKFNDVAAEAWYAEAVSKAVAMGAFQGDDDGNFNPENNITFQETYIVLSRMFGFEPYTVVKNGVETAVSGAEEGVLDSFSDKAELADWAKDYAKYIVGNGGWSGIDGKLNPTSKITRGQFAYLMNSIVTTYIDAPGEYKELPDGLTMVRCGGVTIDGLNTDKNLIVAYGVDSSGLKVTNSTVNGVTLVYGGQDTTLVANKDGKMLPDESYITLEGTFYDVRDVEAGVYINASSAKISYYKGCEASLVSLSLN